MIMPFIRLIAIYFVVIVAVVAFFKRDQLMELSSATIGWPQAETTNVAEPQVSTEEPADQTDTATPEPTTEVAAVQTPVADEAAKPDAIQMPVADEKTSAAPKPETAPKAETKLAKPAGSDTKSRLNAARQAYWNGDLPGSAALYEALARDVPNDADVNGELGNIYFAQAQYEKAADAYFVTGKLLVGKGNPRQVMPIIGVLQSIAPQKAAALRELAAN